VSAVYSSAANNSSISTPGSWSEATGLIGIDNNGGSNACMSVCYCVKDTTGSTGTYAITQNADTPPDAGMYINQSFYEIPPPGSQLTFPHRSSGGMIDLSGNFRG